MRWCFTTLLLNLGLIQEALEKAYEADLAGDYLSAIKRYQVGLSAIEEGLKQNAKQNGLGPLFDNVARWRKEIAEWQELAEGRCSPLCLLVLTGNCIIAVPAVTTT